MSVAAILFSTEAEFDAATKSAITSQRGLARFGVGDDCSSISRFTNESGVASVSVGGVGIRKPGGTGVSIASLNGSSVTDGVVRGNFEVGSNAADCGPAARIQAGGNSYHVEYYAAGPTLYLEKAVVTVLSSVADTFAAGTSYEFTITMTGTSITAKNETSGNSTAATDATYASGKFGIYLYNDASIAEWVRLDSTALSGSISLPTSTTYKDLGAAKLMGSVSWEEDLASGGDVTVDVYGSDDGASDAVSVTGLTDPAGSDCSAAGSHRYWRTVVNFTRDNTTQEPTVSRIALNQTAAAGGGAARSMLCGAGGRVS